MITIETGKNKFICVIKDTEQDTIKVECPSCDTRRFHTKCRIDHSFIDIDCDPIIQLQCDCGADIQIIGKTSLIDKEILKDLL